MCPLPLTMPTVLTVLSFARKRFLVCRTKDYCKSIGCKIKLVARAAVAELTMPLEFPVRRRGGPQK